MGYLSVRRNARLKNPFISGTAILVLMAQGLWLTSRRSFSIDYALYGIGTIFVSFATWMLLARRFPKTSTSPDRGVIGYVVTLMFATACFVSTEIRHSVYFLFYLLCLQFGVELSNAFKTRTAVRKSTKKRS